MKKIDGHIDTLDKLLHSFKFMRRRVVMVHLQPTIPSLPEHSKWNDLVVFIKVVGPEGHEPFWIYSLTEDAELALQKAKEMVAEMGGAVTGEGRVQ